MHVCLKRKYKSSSQSVPIRPVSAPVRPVSAPVRHVSASVRPVSVPVRHVSPSVCHVSAFSILVILYSSYNVFAFIFELLLLYRRLYPNL